MAAKKKSRKKKTSRKKAARKPSRRKSTQAQLIGTQLPRSLAALRLQLRRDLSRIERHLGTAGKATRVSLARVIRDASHQLGVLEARGERQFRSMSARAKRELEKTLRRVRRAVKA